MIAIQNQKSNESESFISACFDAVRAADKHDEDGTEAALLAARQKLDVIINNCKRRGELGTIADYEQQFINCVRSCRNSFINKPLRPHLTLVKTVNTDNT